MESQNGEVRCPKCGKANSRHSLICASCLAALPTPQFGLSSEGLKAEFEKRTSELWSRVNASASNLSANARPLRGSIGLPPVFGKKDLRRHSELDALDSLMDEDFGLSRRLQGASRDYPTIYCETLEEYFDPYLKILNLSETTKKEIIQHLITRAEEEAQNTGGGGEFGVNWPGLGCFINGWLFAYKRTSDAAAALKDSKILPFILATVAHEKHGHGFITEYTMSGREKKDIQLFRQDLASRFNVKLADTPEDVLLQEKWSILFHSSVFLEEGWSVWVEKRLLKRLQERQMAGIDWGSIRERKNYRLVDVWPVLARLAGRGEEKAAAARSCDQALHHLFGGDIGDVPKTHAACRALEDSEELLADDFAQAFGQYPRYVLGYLLVEKVERAVGAGNVPFAVAIAANVKYGLQTIANSDLARVAAGEPRLNLNTRLALLSGLELSRKDDLSELAARAREELNLKIPENLKV